MREETEMSVVVENLLAHFQCSDIFQLPTGKCKGHDADENIFQTAFGKCGSGFCRCNGEHRANMLYSSCLEMRRT
jgi:hypothetical protein